MNPGTIETLLRFTGNWPLWPVLATAAVLAGLMFWLYRRELRMHAGAARWVPALLRALAVFILVLALAGPVLRHVTTFRQLGRVIIAVDASASMSYADTQNPKSKIQNQPSNDPQSRFSLVEKALLDPANSLVRRLSQKHDVELTLLRGSKTARVWWRRQDGADTSGDLPSTFGIVPDATVTNLDEPLRAALGTGTAGTAMVVFTDGQHNGPGSPEDMASALHESGVSLFTIGCGSEIPPPDLALINILAPEAIFAGDRAEGVLVVSDTLPPNLHAQASITFQNKTVWQQTFTTTGMGERHFDFSFPAQELAPAGSDSHQTLRLLNVRVEVAGNETTHDLASDNKHRELALHLLTRRRRALILDGRPRWETRYVKNHFSRDERWSVNAAFDDFTSGATGDIERAFPKTKNDLMAYDLIVLGDLRPDALTPEQQGLIEEFVNVRGGGLILVDGKRSHLHDWMRTKAAPLVPVSWTEEPAASSLQEFDLTNEGKNLAALRLTDSATTNPAFWTRLPKVDWRSAARPLPDATALVNFTADDRALSPAIVWRRYGAGSVLWLGTDEFWRWRYEVADQHHQRFWMQIASWIAAPPFLVEDKHVSLGTDKLRYEEGDTAELRVRLRDDKGGIITDASPSAHLLRNGQEIATLEMEPDASHGGVYRAVTGELPAGDYQISISQGSAPPSETRLSFRVESLANQEWAQLNMNRPLLESMAQRSGGRFLRFGDLSQLPDLLQTLDREETRVNETLLWSSWWWFATLITLLTAEWLLRKHWRLV